jgi:hypothetical protein
MRTDELIDVLVSDFHAIPARPITRALVAACLFGAGAALLIVAFGYGPRADLGVAMATNTSFWMKWLYALSLALAAALLCGRMARPGGRPGWRLPLIAVPVLILSVIAITSIFATPVESRRAVWLGQSALQCPWNIALLALPIFAGLCWALRFAAPTRLRWAGFAAGLLSGAIGAFIYCLHCPEHSSAFVVTWYSIGIFLPAALGALLGPRLLRWK